MRLNGKYVISFGKYFHAYAEDSSKKSRTRSYAELWIFYVTF